MAVFEYQVESKEKLSKGGIADHLPRRVFKKDGSGRLSATQLAQSFMKKLNGLGVRFAVEENDLEITVFYDESSLEN